MTMELRVTQKVGIETTGGVSETVFPKTEAKLEDTDYQEALEFVGARKNMEKYHSMMDFIFCEIFKEWRFHCFSFYNGRGVQLRHCKDVDALRLKAYDVILCDVVLEFALQMSNDKLACSWSDLYKATHSYIKAA